MRAFLPFLFLAFLVFGIAEAQTFEVGSGAQIYRFRGEALDGSSSGFNYVDETKLNLTAIFLGNIPIKKFHDDEMSIGISPNLSLGTFYDLYAADIPVYATLKYGTTATRNAKSTFGAGIGAGYQFSAVAVVLNSNGIPIRYNTTYFSPTIMVELSADFSDTVYKLRIDSFVFPYDSFNRSFNGDINQLNIRIIKTFH